MSTNSANPDNAPDFDANEPIPDSGVNYDEYASDSDSSEKSNDTFSFHSSDINKQKKAEYFVNVEGAKRIKREQERREAEAKKKQIAELKRIDKKLKDKSDAEQKSANAVKEKMLRDDKKHAQKIARAEKKRRRKDAIKSTVKRIYRALFAGKKKIIWLGAIILIIIAICIFFISRAISANVEKSEDEAFDDYEKNASEVVDMIEGTISEMRLDHSENMNEEIMNYINSELQKYNKGTVEYFMISVIRCSRIGKYQQFNEGIKCLDEIDSNNMRDFQKESLYYAYYEIYSAQGNFAKGNEYAEKVRSLKRRVFTEGIRSSEEYYEEWNK